MEKISVKGPVQSFTQEDVNKGDRLFVFFSTLHALLCSICTHVTTVKVLLFILCNSAEVFASSPRNVVGQSFVYVVGCHSVTHFMFMKQLPQYLPQHSQFKHFLPQLSVALIHIQIKTMCT